MLRAVWVLMLIGELVMRYVVVRPCKWATDQEDKTAQTADGIPPSRRVPRSVTKQAMVGHTTAQAPADKVHYEHYKPEVKVEGEECVD